MIIFGGIWFTAVMKDFLKITLAVIVGCLILGIVKLFVFFGVIGSLSLLGKSEPVMPGSAILRIDLSEVQLAEQTQDMSLMAGISGSQMKVIGILDAVRAIENAAADPAVKYIYLKPDMVYGGMAQIEELRQALVDFRMSGKAVISYMENPSNAGYYLASVSDKIYMTPHAGGMNMMTGISTQMFFLKDLLDKLGINVQLIRHGKYKSAGEMFVRNEPSPENTAQYQEMVDAIWDSWASSIAESRGISPEKFNSAIDNLELNFPQDYVDAGMVDELLTLDQLKEKLTEYFQATSFEKASMISLSDYATLTAVPNFRAGNTVAVIFANGNILDGDAEQQVTGDRFARIISSVRKDENVKAVVLRVNSPGGSVLAAEKIKDEIALLCEEKPVIASYGDYAASGGYWISAGCDYIFTNSSTLTGSIGVFSMIPDFSRTLDDIAHINVRSANSNRHSDMYSCLRPMTEKELAYMQASVENIYETFTDVVAEGRSLDRSYVDEIGQGRVWAGDDAVRLKLADSKGSLMDAVRYAVSASGSDSSDLSDWNIAEYPTPMTAMEMLVKTLGGSSAATSVFSGTPLEDVEEAFADWNSSQSGKVYARLPYELVIR